ncbi:hypothetical protein [Virgibacillus siamensis]|uniref:hypothetical protein n=1 Tax=Virgibacillus siamensis TaxID=480071 RepID=UPI00098706FA|nr:hypothetical protein [Virgibacillus siamensis]
MSEVDQSIKQKANKYKKFFEKVKFNPQHFRLEDADYYLVYYQKRIVDKTKAAVLSSGSNTSLENYEKAFESLILLLTMTGNIQRYGMERKNIDMQAFYKTRTFLETVLEKAVLLDNVRENYKTCWNSLNTQIELQEKHVKLMNEYTTYYDQKEIDGSKFFPEDIEYAKEVFLEMDYIQYKQLLVNRGAVDLFEKIDQDRKDNEHVNELSNHEINQYIKEFAKGERKLTKEINSVTYVEGLEDMNMNEHKEAVWDYFYSEQQKRINSMKKDIRHPNL